MIVEDLLRNSSGMVEPIARGFRRRSRDYSWEFLPMNTTANQDKAAL